ncbi:MAG TPA: hypothetical protein V6C81_07285 [Planktothrix sp.]|jgi:hypothetical protein
MPKSNPEYTTKEKAGKHDTVSPLLNAAYNEMQDLTKKKPEGTLTPYQVKMLNRLLVDIRDMLVDEPSIKYLDLLADEDLPQHSEVTLILSQYSAALGQFKSRYFGYNGNEHAWFVS